MKRIGLVLACLVFLLCGTALAVAPISPLYKARLDATLAEWNQKSAVHAMDAGEDPQEYVVSVNPYSLCLISICWESYCVGSVCGGSYCGGSVCAGSVCASAVCGLSACAANTLCIRNCGWPTIPEDPRGPRTDLETVMDAGYCRYPDR